MTVSYLGLSTYGLVITFKLPLPLPAQSTNEGPQPQIVTAPVNDYKSKLSDSFSRQFGERIPDNI